MKLPQTFLYGNKYFLKWKGLFKDIKNNQCQSQHNDSFKNIYKWFSKWCPWPAASASPGNLIGMHIFKPHCNPTESETDGSQEEGVKQGEGREGGKYGRNPDVL